MKRKVSIQYIEYRNQEVKVLIEKYDPSMIYPTDLVRFDTNFDTIVSKADLSKYIQEYINLYIYGVLGRQGTLSGDVLSSEFNQYIPQYDLTPYEVGKEIELEFDGYELIQDTEVVDTKDRVLRLVNEAESVDDIVEGVKSMFNLVEATSAGEEINQVGKTPSLLRPRTLEDIANLFSQYLSNSAYVKGNYVEFEVPNPISDFRNGGTDTQLMTKIRSFYSNWNSIEVSEKTANTILSSEVYPVADTNIYLKIGSNYVKVVPADIQIQVGGTYINLFTAGPTLPRLVVTDGTNQVDLTVNNLRYLDSNGNSNTVASPKYRSAASGAVGTDLYFKDSNGNYQAISGLSKSMAMFKLNTVQTSCTVFRFYFK